MSLPEQTSLTEATILVSLLVLCFGFKGKYLGFVRCNLGASTLRNAMSEHKQAIE